MGRWGYVVNMVAVLSIAVTNVFYCFPYFLPLDASCVVPGNLRILIV